MCLKTPFKMMGFIRNLLNCCLHLPSKKVRFKMMLLSKAGTIKKIARLPQPVFFRTVRIGPGGVVTLAILGRGTYASEENNLLVCYPKIAGEWDYEKNNPLKPDEVTPKSNKKVWWRCRRDNRHSWRAYVISRTYKNAGCPYCSGNAVDKTNSLLASGHKCLDEWDYEKNEQSPDMFTTNSNQRVHWRCASGHRWVTIIGNRFKGRNCPYCAGKKVQREDSFGFKCPELVAQIHNNPEFDIFSVSMGSHKKLDWKCECGHIWNTSIRLRVGKGGKPGTRCPKCSKKDAHLNFIK